MDIHKTCSHCQHHLPLSMFHRHGYNAVGDQCYRNRCVACDPKSRNGRVARGQQRMVGKHKYQQRTMSEEAYLLRREIDGESDRARITAITDAHRPVWSHQ